jgi:type IV secretory pathway VirB4 component
MAEVSPVVASAETFEVCRAYIFDGDSESKVMVENIIGTNIKGDPDVRL